MLLLLMKALLTQGDAGHAGNHKNITSVDMRADVWTLDYSQNTNTLFPEESTLNCLLVGKIVRLWFYTNFLDLN